MADDTETDRRNALRAAITARDAARIVAIAARDAHDRAVRNRERAQTAVRRYESLDEEIEQHTITALRNGDSARLPDTLAEQVTERQRAAVDLAAADHAVGVLQADLTEAIAHAEQCDAAVKAALRAITMVERDRLREEARRLKAKSEAIQQLAGWSDTADPWRGICDALLDDPEQASITITDLPDEPTAEPKRPAFVIVPPMDEMLDPATGETVSVAEFHRRRRAEILAQAGPGVTEAMAIEQAIRRSRKLAG